MDKEKLLKIKRLAERGIGGEKTSARRILNKLLEQNEMDESQLSDKKEYRWAYKNKDEKILLIQTITKYTNSNEIFEITRLKELTVDCTQEQADWITVSYNIYKTDYRKLLKDTLRAFIHTNKIYGTEMSDKELTDQEYENYKRMEKLSSVMSKSNLPVAQIKND